MPNDKPRPKPRHQVTALVAALQKFPAGAAPVIPGGVIRFNPESWGTIEHHAKRGFIAKPTNKNWMDTVFDSDGGKIQRWLLENPAEARAIAFAAIAGLFLDDTDERALPEYESYPRGSGSDYVDHVGEALEAAGIMPLIKEMRHRAENSCSECGAPTDDGEGYDGLCGNCADRKEAGDA